MQLSNRTVDILRNYASINENIVIESGNVIKTMSPAKNLVSKSEIEESFPQGFGIYDLPEFLSVLTLVDNPIIKFSDDYCTVSDGSGLSSVKYFYSDPEMLSAPKKDITMPECEVKFVLNTDTLSKIKRAASALGHGEISIKPSGGSIEISVVNNKNQTSNAFSIVVEGSYPELATFEYIMSVSNLKLINEGYEVAISSKLISNFKSLDSSIEYFIALEKTSTYGA
jgi:hypothetical protein